MGFFKSEINITMWKHLKNRYLYSIQEDKKNAEIKRKTFFAIFSLPKIYKLKNFQNSKCNINEKIFQDPRLKLLTCR